MQEKRGTDKRTPRQKAIDALELREPRGLVPTFELDFQLPDQLVGKEYLDEHEEGISESEKERRLWHNAELQLEVVERLDYSIIMAPPERIEKIRSIEGDKFLYVCHGDATYGIPSGSDMMSFVIALYEREDEMLQQAEQRVNKALEDGKRAMEMGVDGFALCADYCFNDGPFLSPQMFRRFITPFLARLIEGYRQMGAYVIKHTDGDIMPIIDQLVQCRPHALHSLDPMAGVDIAEVKRLYGGEVCLIGNVNCALMQTGTLEEIRASAEYALRSGMPGGGYIFSTSNCVFRGLPLERYLLILKLRKELGWYS